MAVEHVAEARHAPLAADALHLHDLLDMRHRLLRPDAVHRPSGGDPGVVRGARPVRRLVADDARITADVAGPRCVAEEIRVVVLLPAQDQVRRGHERRDVRAAGRRTRKRIGPHAPPAVVVGGVVVVPDLLVLDDLVLEDDGSLLHRRKGYATQARVRPRSMTLWSALRKPAVPQLLAERGLDRA